MDMVVEIIIKVVTIVLGCVIGIYLTLVISYGDWNIKRGISNWLDKTIKEIFKEL